MNRDALQREAAELRSKLQKLETALAEPAPAGEWPPRTFYTVYHALAGFALGIFGACTSLLFNIIGSLILQPGESALRLIQVYLTFPLGEQALHINEGLTLAVGVCLYLGTGMLLGMPFHLVLSRYFDRSSFTVRLGVVTAMGLALWLINFYGILFWLQPLLFGGRWIVDLIPWWVAASTHLVFAWTMLLVQPLGVFMAPLPAKEEQ